MVRPALVLRMLAEGDEEAFLAGLRAWEGDDASWHSFVWGAGISYAGMLERLRDDRLGVGLAPGRVPHTMLYGFVDGVIVGRCSVRHELNEGLRRRGGHVGYAVAPPFRRRGYAGEMLRQGLVVCAELGLPAVMLTCDDDNAGSWKTIERAGGALAERVWDEENAAWIRRYWIGLSPAGPGGG